MQPHTRHLRFVNVLLLMLVVVSAACGRKASVEEPVAPAAEGASRVFWVIATGPDDDEEVCTSEHPADCVIEAGLPGENRTAVFRLHLRPGGATTTYQGSIDAGFVAAAKVDVNREVPASPARDESHPIIVRGLLQP